MAFIDYYSTLGLSKNASEKEIKNAYRKLARKYHPDVNPNDHGAEKKFKEVNEANEVLSNPTNRKKYDQYGKDWKHAEEFEKARKQQRHHHTQQGPSGGFSGTGGFSGGDYSDFFESMFGGGPSAGGGRTTRFRGQDFHAELHLTLSDIYVTHKRTLTVNGKNIRITIPAGVNDGQEIRLKGHGGEGINGGPSGDLLIRFIVQNDTKFKREKDDLYVLAEVDLYTALLGGELIVDTFDGKVKLKVAPGAQNGTKVKLKGKGFPVYKADGKFGDLYITYHVKIPTNLTDKEKQLFSDLAKLRTP
jgi:curved DNA-binding protein